MWKVSSTRMSSSTSSPLSSSAMICFTNSRLWLPAEISHVAIIIFSASLYLNLRLITSRRSLIPTMRCLTTSRVPYVSAVMLTTNTESSTAQSLMMTIPVFLRALRTLSSKLRTSMRRSSSGLRTRCISKIMSLETSIAQ